MSSNISNKKIREQILNKYDGKCAYCGVNLEKLTIDHIEPKRRGATSEEVKKYGRGSDAIDNYNPCCQSCNSSKSTFSIEEWRREISLKHERVLKSSSNYRLLNRFSLVKVAEEVLFHFEKIRNNG